MLLLGKFRYWFGDCLFCLVSVEGSIVGWALAVHFTTLLPVLSIKPIENRCFLFVFFSILVSCFSFPRDCQLNHIHIGAVYIVMFSGFVCLLVKLKPKLSVSIVLYSCFCTVLNTPSQYIDKKGTSGQLARTILNR